MRLHGWGRYPVIDAKTCSSETLNQLRECLPEENKTDCIPYALGRSYGDSALNDRVIMTRKLNKLLFFDSERGVLSCEAGVSLADLLEVFVPRGWFLPVTPGTKHVTVGGAIASDIHGKNHHLEGCFSNHLLSFNLMLADGSVVTCSRDQNRKLFHATCGGMGLTGIITRAKIQLKSVNSTRIQQKSIKASDLEEIFHLFEEYADWPYSVAWVDCLARKENLGRSVLMVGQHADDGDLDYNVPSKKPVPFNFPSWMLNRYSVRAFNKLYYQQQRQKMSEKKVDLESFFYPLDTIHNWNRIYGKNGFLQYQFVLPKSSSFEGLKKILEKIADEGRGSFLSVLKLMGRENDNYLSFPMKGYTLALDFKRTPDLFPFLDELDRIVLEHGGRIYLTKDARMPKSVFQNSYPDLDKFWDIRKKYNLHTTFNSLQSQRLGL